jgi:hypothetical protein
MSEEPPRKLNYERQRRSVPEDMETRYPVLKFFIGFGGGVALSAVVWPLARASDGAVLGGIMAAMPIFKAFVAGCFMVYRPFKLVGAGLLASMAVGCLIFLSQCGPVV